MIINLVSAMYSTGLNSTTSLVTPQRTDRHGILDQKPPHFQLLSGPRQGQYSPSGPSNRALQEQLEALALETTEGWERDGIAQGQIGPIVGTVDETFLQRLMLVFMDLVSGYVLLEEVADGQKRSWRK